MRRLLGTSLLITLGYVGGPANADATFRFNAKGLELNNIIGRTLVGVTRDNSKTWSLHLDRNKSARFTFSSGKVQFAKWRKPTRNIICFTGLNAANPSEEVCKLAKPLGRGMDWKTVKITRTDENGVIRFREATAGEKRGTSQIVYTLPGNAQVAPNTYRSNLNSWRGRVVVGRTLKDKEAWSVAFHRNGSFDFVYGSGRQRSGTYTLTSTTVCFRFPAAPENNNCRKPRVSGGKILWENTKGGRAISEVVYIRALNAPTNVARNTPAVEPTRPSSSGISTNVSNRAPVNSGANRAPVTSSAGVNRAPAGGGVISSNADNGGAGGGVNTAPGNSFTSTGTNRAPGSSNSAPGTNRAPASNGVNTAPVGNTARTGTNTAPAGGGSTNRAPVTGNAGSSNGAPVNRAPVNGAPVTAASPADQALNTALSSNNARKMYFAAVKFESDGDGPRAKTLYQKIMDSFPEDDLALKAADRLVALKNVRAHAVTSAADAAANAAQRKADADRRAREAKKRERIDKVKRLVANMNRNHAFRSGYALNRAKTDKGRHYNYEVGGSFRIRTISSYPVTGRDHCSFRVENSMHVRREKIEFGDGWYTTVKGGKNVFEFRFPKLGETGTTFRTKKQGNISTKDDLEKRIVLRWNIPVRKISQSGSLRQGITYATEIKLPPHTEPAQFWKDIHELRKACLFAQ